jgi:hypothetical protein
MPKMRGCFSCRSARKETEDVDRKKSARSGTNKFRRIQKM